MPADAVQLAVLLVVVFQLVGDGMDCTEKRMAASKPLQQLSAATSVRVIPGKADYLSHCRGLAVTVPHIPR